MGRFTFNDIKNERYENWFFIPMLVMVIVPLLIMGCIACIIFYQGEKKKNDQQLESFCESICMEYDNVLMSIKSYYMDVSVKDEFEWMHDQKAVPYSRVSKIRKAQSLLEGNNLLEKYVKNYNYINVENGWVLNKYGMFPYNMTKNLSEADAFLEMQKEKEFNIYWMNCMDDESPYDGIAIESRMIDLSRELFVIKKHNHTGELQYLLVVQIDTDQLNRIVEKQKDAGFQTVILSQNQELFGKLDGFTSDYVTKTGKSALYEIECVAGYDRSALQEMSFVFVRAAIIFSMVLCIITFMIRYLSILFAGPIRHLKSLERYKNMQIKELFVANLTSGKLGLPEKKIKDRLRNMDLEEWPLYRVVIIKLKAKNSEALAEAIVKNLPEEILEQIFVMPICQNGGIVFLVGEKEEFSLDEKTASLYKQVKDYIWNNYEVAISAGISCSTPRLTAIQHSYEECEEALHHNRNRASEYSTLVVYDDYGLKKDYRHNAYDIVVQDELLTALEKGNREETCRLLDLALEILENRAVTGIERKIYIVRLITAMLAVAQKKGFVLNDIFAGELYEDLSMFTTTFDKDTLALNMKNKIINPLLLVMAKGDHEDADKQISNQILSMIKETKGAVSLSECAERVNYHANHVGKILKRDTGKTFSELVNEEKMEAAKYLLLTTDYSIAEISEKLSYNNVQNFIRFFKANAQVTPSAFRKNHKH